MSMRLVFPHHWQTQKWQNGGGITHELIKDTQTEWRYRLSIADVAQDGPFSHFAGIDRIILLLEGKGFELYFGGGHLQAVTKPFEPFPFRGDDPVNCDLIDGPVRDFNVMTRRENTRAYAQVYALNASRTAVPLGTFIHFVFVLHGRAFAELNEHGHVLDAQQLLVIENEQHPLHLSAVDGDALVYSISVDLK